MNVQAFFDADTSTLTYVAYDPESRDAVVIDPVLDLDTRTYRVHTASVDEVTEFVASEGLSVHWILDTHAHADHLTGMDVLEQRLGAKTAIGEHITAVQGFFAPVFELGEDFPVDGRQWDHLLRDGETLEAGSLRVEVIHTPGHTPACVTLKIGDAIFTGDAMFMPDSGTGRCDFPRGSATDLYESIAHKLYALPDATRVFVGHDYQPGGRALRYETTIGEQKRTNKQLVASTSEADFVSMREARDATLSAPRLILQSLQVNVDAGRLPDAGASGRPHLKIPLNFLGA